MAIGYVSLKFGRQVGTININVIILGIEMVYKTMMGLYEIAYREYVKRRKGK